MRKRPAKRRPAAPAAAVPGAAAPVAAVRAAAMPPGAATTAQGSSPAPAPLRLRSWLFVPGDSERKQDKALGTEADAVIFDLEDSVTAGQLAHARELVRERLRGGAQRGGPQLWVRVNPPASALIRNDLDAVCAETAPAGIVLPKVSSATEVADAAAYLDALEQRLGRTSGSVRLLLIATETPLAVLALPQLPVTLGRSPPASARLAGLTWGAEDLGAALGVLGRRDAAGALTFTFQLARASCLLAAAALGVQAIDGVHTVLKDPRGLKRELADARRDGFTGKLAIHPEQVAPINAAFAPTSAEREHARRVVAAFAAAPGGGVASLDGQMIDRPHLLQAQRILAEAQREREKA